MNDSLVCKRYELAQQVYAAHGVDTEQAMAAIDAIPISMHSWQGDDLLGFEGAEALTGGIQATGNYPGRARTAAELRSDLDVALSCVPGTMKVSLHAVHAEKDGRKVDRDEYDVSLFERWIDWANARNIGLDFNPTFFSHPMSDGNFSVTSLDEKKRRFWIEHGKRCREISAEIGKRTGKTCIDNFWFPDGYKDIPADTLVLRESMTQALDEIFAAKFDPKDTVDALESKLFGLGVESYTVASHEFSLLYAATRNILYTLDAGHFHPTESIAAKLTAILNFLPQVMLHVSRGTATTSSSGTTSFRPSPLKSSTTAIRAASTSASTTSMPPSTASPAGSSACATRARLCSRQRSIQWLRSSRLSRRVITPPVWRFSRNPRRFRSQMCGITTA